jgi:transcriptional regulator with XRE-family HTH domain
MSEQKITFGIFLAAKRKDKSLSIRKLAELLKITPAYLSDIEKDRRYAPDKEKLDGIARLLSITEEEKNIMFDLAGKSKGEIPPDLPEYIIEKDIVKVALRTANKNNASDEDWERFIDQIKKGNNNNA